MTTEAATVENATNTATMAIMQQGNANAGNADATGQSVPFYESFDPEVKEYAAKKGWKDPAAAINSYRELERFLGADKAGRGLIMPKDDASPEELAAFYNKLGRPESADGYKLPLPEGDTGEFAKVASGWFHDVGLTEKQAANLAEKWNAYTAEFAKNSEAAKAEDRAKAGEQELAALKKEWGSQYDVNLEASRRAVREYGVDADMLDKIESAIGAKAMLGLFSKIGLQQGEHTFIEGKAGESTFGMTAGQAKAEIELLKKDKAFAKQLIDKDATAMARWSRLNRLASGG